MSARALAAALAGLVLGGAVVFWALARQLGGSYAAPEVTPDLIATLEQSQAELKLLAALDPGRAAAYRERFETAQRLLNRLRILEHNRRAIAVRFRLLLLAIVGLTLAAFGAAVALRYSRDAARLGHLRAAVEALARGEVDIAIPVRGHDAVGRVAAMVAEASRLVVRDRRRLAALQSLAAWQETARRVLHEVRTPLTSARLGLERAESLLHDGRQGGVTATLAQVRADVDRLGQLTGQFAGFARLAPPRLEPIELRSFLGEYAATFGEAWPKLRLTVDPASRTCSVRADRGLLRQVLTNLCENAARALGDCAGGISLTVRTTGGHAIVDVTDDGPGMPEAIRERVFEPYVTTAPAGEGLGLGLAISRKILLDHGGELEVVTTGPGGTVFRLTLPLETTE